MLLPSTQKVKTTISTVQHSQISLVFEKLPLPHLPRHLLHLPVRPFALAASHITSQNPFHIAVAALQSLMLDADSSPSLRGAIAFRTFLEDNFLAKRSFSFTNHPIPWHENICSNALDSMRGLETALVQNRPPEHGSVPRDQQSLPCRVEPRPCALVANDR